MRYVALVVVLLLLLLLLACSVWWCWCCVLVLVLVLLLLLLWISQGCCCAITPIAGSRKDRRECVRVGKRSLVVVVRWIVVGTRNRIQGCI
jgi:hypothetical protein